MVCGCNIRNVKVKGGYSYCVAFIDGYSRKVMGMGISNTPRSEFCVEALREAVQKHRIPEVVHTDKGKQFVGKEFAELLKDMRIKLSVSERGFKESLLIERFWRTYKYEFVYLWDRMELKEVRKKTKDWIPLQFKKALNSCAFTRSNFSTVAKLVAKALRSFDSTFPLSRIMSFMSFASSWFPRKWCSNNNS